MGLPGLSSGHREDLESLVGTPAFPGSQSYHELGVAVLEGAPRVPVAFLLAVYHTALHSILDLGRKDRVGGQSQTPVRDESHASERGDPQQQGKNGQQHTHSVPARERHCGLKHTVRDPINPRGHPASGPPRITKAPRSWLRTVSL
jgi:hypothetical protein